MSLYIIVVTDDRELRNSPPIISKNLRIDFIGICQQTIGKHFRGKRYNVIHNHTSITDLSKADDNRIVDWYRRELIGCAARDVIVINGGGD
ncbi:hypothetical protein GJU41_11895 [Bacillus idriensis]|uniref:Uncharacterized protein n=1 Tax=Metabacillus idriensis TaxID=324768 RepID=A0A6I2M8N2_9BACI|nr:hypothetical protein [Metabacillus idriensis]MRX54675.1 hypothetical protein [Metabacillus idriensis]